MTVTHSAMVIEVESSWRISIELKVLCHQSRPHLADGKLEVAAGGERGERDADGRQIEEHDDRKRPGGDQGMAGALASASPWPISAPGTCRGRSGAAPATTSAPTTSISSTASAAPERPVLRIGEGDLDVVGDRDDALPAQHLGLGDGADGEHEGEQEADHDAGHGERQFHLLEHLPARGAEIEGRVARFVRHHARCRASSGNSMKGR